MATYACSDLHGNWELWTEIKKFLKPDDTLYYLGDATDRGPDGWAILKEMLNDSRINYIATLLRLINFFSILNIEEEACILVLTSSKEVYKSIFEPQGESVFTFIILEKSKRREKRYYL